MGKIVLLLIPLFFINLYAQNNKNLENSSFQKVRIKFSGGFTYTGPAKFEKGKIFLSNRTYDFKKVQRIQVPKGNYTFEGLLMGAVVGAGILIIAKNIHGDEVKVDNRGYVTQDPFPGWAFMGIPGGFTLLGAIIGRNTMKWSTIFIKQLDKTKLSVKIKESLNLKKGLFLSLKYDM